MAPAVHASKISIVFSFGKQKFVLMSENQHCFSTNEKNNFIFLLNVYSSGL